MTNEYVAKDYIDDCIEAILDDEYDEIDEMIDAYNSGDMDLFEDLFENFDIYQLEDEYINNTTMYYKDGMDVINEFGWYNGWNDIVGGPFDDSSKLAAGMLNTVFEEFGYADALKEAIIKKAKETK